MPIEVISAVAMKTTNRYSARLMAMRSACCCVRERTLRRLIYL